MSNFTFPCPACGQSILGDTNSSGMQVSCPHCQAAIVMPQGPGGGAPVGPQKTSGLAIASLVCSLAVCAGCIPGIICGHMAKSRIRRNPALKGLGLANAGLAIGYLSLILGLTSAGIFAYHVTQVAKAGLKDFNQQLVDMQNSNATPTTIVSTDTNAASTNDITTATPETTDTKPDAAAEDPLWTLDLDTVTFPNQPSAGKFRGTNFLGDQCLYKNGTLTIKNNDGYSFIIKLPIQKGESVVNTTYRVLPTDTAPTCKVSLGWKVDTMNKTLRIQKGYAMKLEFGKAVRKKVTGKIYLCMPGKPLSYVVGNFSAGTK